MVFEVDLNILEGFGDEVGERLHFWQEDQQRQRRGDVGRVEIGERTGCLKGDWDKARLERKRGTGLSNTWLRNLSFWSGGPCRLLSPGVIPPELLWGC